MDFCCSLFHKANIKEIICAFLKTIYGWSYIHNKTFRSYMSSKMKYNINSASLRYPDIVDGCKLEGII